MFAIEHWGVEPDLISVAKSLAAGMPIAAVVGRQEIMDSVHPWGLGGTFGANPVACAAALAVLEVFEEGDMLGKAKAVGKKLSEAFRNFKKKYRIVGSIRGLGAILGLELVKIESREPAAEEARKLAALCLERGLIILICGTHSNIVRVLVPFVVTDEQLRKGLSILDQGLSELSN
jgi:4-aminobutyrate aminotransferase/(S)-3-amino-2-methylpropionate transaminase